MRVLRKTELPLREVRQWAEEPGLFAVLDACDTPQVLDLVRRLGPARAVSLYRGMSEEYLEAIAPYLVAVDEDVFDWIVDEVWEGPWGIFVRADADLEIVRKHLRKFLIVESPDGEPWYFRFYDPRVLQAYLPTCTEAEVLEFFGSMSAALVGRGGRGPIAEFQLVSPFARVTLRQSISGEALSSEPIPSPPL